MEKLPQYNLDIPMKYKNNSLHIALEMADNDKNWKVFNKLYNLSPDFLQIHLNTTKNIFDYNFLQLSKEEQEKLFI